MYIAACAKLTELRRTVHITISVMTKLKTSAVAKPGKFSLRKSIALEQNAAMLLIFHFASFKKHLYAPPRLRNEMFQQAM